MPPAVQFPVRSARHARRDLSAAYEGKDYT